MWCECWIGLYLHFFPAPPPVIATQFRAGFFFFLVPLIFIVNNLNIITIISSVNLLNQEKLEARAGWVWPSARAGLRPNSMSDASAPTSYLPHTSIPHLLFALQFLTTPLIKLTLPYHTSYLLYASIPHYNSSYLLLHTSLPHLLFALHYHTTLPRRLVLHNTTTLP